VLRLVELEAAISGEVRSDDAVLAAWSGERLSAWQQRLEGADVVISSPELGRVREVGAVELEITPGGASRLDLSPTMHGDAGDSIRRARRVEVPLERDPAPGRSVHLRIDVAEAIGGNIADTVHDPQLVQLDITVREPMPGGFRLHAVRLLRRDVVAVPFAARRAVAEIDGRLHPSWWVRGGGAVEMEVNLPAGEPSLRWFQGMKGSGALPRVEVITSGRSLALGGGSEREDERSWRLQRASLANHAGERVRIRLSNAGSGIALFGDPRVVARAEPPRPSDVLVYLIDTLRADHVGAFGASYPGITPNLDRLIEAGVGFEMALAHSPWTKPSIATLMTGLLPTTHRVGSGALSDRLPATVPVVQERFQQAGWRTGAFAANPLGSTLSGLERGFGTALAPRFWRRRPALGRNPSGAQIRKEVLRWLDEEPDRPFFAYVHVMEAHPSGRAHHGRGRPEGYTAYGASVRAADADLGALLEALAERGRDDLLVIVLSDHGDSRGVHGWRFKGHGTSLFQDQIHVPLVFWHGHGTPGVVRQPAGLAEAGGRAARHRVRTDPVPACSHRGHTACPGGSRPPKGAPDRQQRAALLRPAERPGRDRLSPTRRGCRATDRTRPADRWPHRTARPLPRATRCRDGGEDRCRRAAAAPSPRIYPMSAKVGWVLALLYIASAAPVTAELLLLDDGRWQVHGVVEASAPRIQVQVDGTAAGEFAALRFRYRGDEVLVLRGDGEIEPRLPGGAPGATASLGHYWDCERGLVGPLRFVSLELPARSKKNGKLDLRGELSNLDSLVSEKLRIRIRPPKPERLRLEFRYRLRTTRALCIDRERRETQEEFRVVELAARYLGPDSHTNDLTRYVRNRKLDCDIFDCDIDKVTFCAPLVNETGYVIEKPRRLDSRKMSLFHTSDMPTRSPTLELEIRKPRAHDIKPQGFVDESVDPQARNVAFWADWVEVKGRYREGRKVGKFRFALEALPPREPGCDRVQD
jgi:hypothetical protein